MAVVGTLARMYRESEMVIWFASGRGMLHLLPPLLRFAWPVILAIATLALLIWPWANQQIQQLKVQYEQRSDVDRIAPGEFQESANGARVFFIDRETPDNQQATNVFIASNEHGRETVTSARSARLETRGNQRMALLSDGQRLETSLDKPGLKVSEFSEYGTRIGGAASSSSDDGAVKTRSTAQLFASSDPVFRAELGWRFGLAFAALNFVVLGLAVASANLRAAREHQPGVRAFRLRGLLQPHDLRTELGGRGPHGPGRLHGRLAWRHAGAGTAALAARHNRWSPRLPSLRVRRPA